MDDDELLQVFDTQIRRAVSDPPPGFLIDLLDDPAPMLRVTATEGAPWGGGIFWSDLDETTADAAIAAAVEWFRPGRREFEWKHYGYDRPPDLPDRLLAAGFEPEEEEALLVGEVGEVQARLAGATAPAGVTVRRLREDDEGRAADWAAVDLLQSAVWDEDATGRVAAVSAEQADAPDAMSVWLAEVGDGPDGDSGADRRTVVSAAWVRFHEGSEFASLWGGSTLAEYRGRGIYKALVSSRADEAAERGFRYLQVDASPDSRPILERLGLRTLTSTTPYIWRPTP